MTALRRFAFLAALAAAVLAGATSARAQAGAKGNQQAALQHDESARKAFRLGEFDKAIEEWKEAYRLESHPVFLYNIAQAYRRKESLEQAMFFYKQYLQESPDAANREEVERRIGEIEAALKTKKEATSARPEDPLSTTTGTTPAPTGGDEATPTPNNGTGTTGTGTAAPAPSSSPGDDRVDTSSSAGRTSKRAGIGVGGAGIALVATSIVFAAKASSAQSDVEAAVAANEPWTDELQDRDDSGRSSATVAKVTLGLGLVATGVGTYLYLRGRSQAKEAEASRVSFAPTVGPDGVGFAFELRY